jgi:hypothetical protein
MLKNVRKTHRPGMQEKGVGGIYRYLVPGLKILQTKEMNSSRLETKCLKCRKCVD